MTETRKQGRPTVMTPEVIEKLENAFALGHTDDEACLIVDIDPASLYRYCEDNPNFATKKERLKQTPTIKARRNIIERLNSKDVETSKWYLARKNKGEFSERTDITSMDEKVESVLVYIPKEDTE